MTDLERFINYGDQAYTDAIAWHTANNPNLTDEQKHAFEAGFRQAWTQARSTISLHKLTV